jgi:hypothetical protein
MYGNRKATQNSILLENNEYLKKYTRNISILPKDATAPAHSQCCSPALRREVPAPPDLTFESFLVRHPAPHTTNNRGSV